MATQSGSAPSEAAAAKSTTLIQKLDAWGSSPLPPMGLATLVAALHLRPLQPFPLLFAPALLFAGYVNVAGYAVDAAGMTAAWSGLYVLLSLRRRSTAAAGAGAAAAAAAVARGWGPAAVGAATSVASSLAPRWARPLGRVAKSVASRALSSGKVSAAASAAAAPYIPASLRTSSRRMQTPARRMVGTVAMAVGAVNCAAGGVVYGITGDRAKEAAAREERNRWGDH